MAKTRLSPARKVALSVLDEARRRDGYTRELLDSSALVANLDVRDAGLARRLALGVTATRGCLDELLDRFLARPNKVAPRVRIALRISTFELMYLGTAAEVAVSQGVELARAVMPSAAGLANAVLRKVAMAGAGYLEAEDVPKGEYRLVSAARRAGLPLWLAREIEASRGRDAAASLFAAELAPAPIAAHGGVAFEAGSLSLAEGSEPADSLMALPGCIVPVDVRNERTRRQLACGAVVVADAHAQLIATAATRPGSCLEIGAGRGTKTYIMASQASRAGYVRRHVALDLYEGKCRQNLERLHRASIGGVETAAGDACDLDTALASLDAKAGERCCFGTVFVDAPCSGTGTMRRHPEIPWRLTSQDASVDLPHLQLTMLQQAATRVGAGGELLYATCSILKQENEAVVDAFLKSFQGATFKLVPVSAAEIFSHSEFASAASTIQAHESDRGFFQTIPAPGGFDGHFCARLIKLS